MEIPEITEVGQMHPCSGLHGLWQVAGSLSSTCQIHHVNVGAYLQ